MMVIIGGEQLAANGRGGEVQCAIGKIHFPVTIIGCAQEQDGTMDATRARFGRDQFPPKPEVIGLRGIDLGWIIIKLKTTAINRYRRFYPIVDSGNGP